MPIQPPNKMLKNIIIFFFIPTTNNKTIIVITGMIPHSQNGKAMIVCEKIL